MPVDAPWPDAARLQPLPAGSNVTTMASKAAASPHAASGSTTPHVQDGSTPSVTRAETLASTTPADIAPIEIAALPKFSRGPHGLITQNETVVGIAQYHPDYATMIETAKSAPEQRCLAQAVYFEARSEPEEGQAAVAQVVLNRAMSGLYPGSVCGVVFQNQERRDACQFSFACDGHPLRMTESRRLGQRGPDRPRGHGRLDLCVGHRRLDALSRQLRDAVLGALAEEDGGDRPPYLLHAEAGSDVRTLIGRSGHEDVNLRPGGFNKAVSPVQRANRVPNQML